VALIVDRIAKIQKSLENVQVDALLITSSRDLFYLTGLDLSAGSLVISKTKAVLLVDGRYLEKCQKSSKIEVVTQAPGALSKVLEKSMRIGFSSDTTSYASFEKLQEEIASPRELVPLVKPIEKIRAVKEAKEIELIQKSIELCIQGLEFLYTRLEKGITEKMVARELELFWIGHGADRLAFEPIIAFGENGSMPHYRAGDTKLKKGDAVLVDIGVVVDHYASDMTRMAFYGAPDPRIQEIYEIVKRAEEAAISACAPGVTSQDLYEVAMDVIEKAGYGENFLHSLGHGIGLDVHEFPILKRDPQPCILEPGMVLTIEPGIYLPGIGGVRIEDMVLITEKGHEVLTVVPKSVNLIE
jgi:Xaa-Pro aminopeptidase